MNIGVLGGGQLGRMLALAGLPLGHRFRFFDPAPDACAGDVAPLVTGDYRDTDSLIRFADGLEVVTYEFENVPVDAALALAAHLHVRPAARALEVAQDRLTEKEFFRGLGIATAPYAPVGSQSELDAAVASLGLPAVLKTRREGYDGKGQLVLRGPSDGGGAFERLGGRPLILEGFIHFRRELSVLAVRALDGGVAVYPLVENRHHEGSLRLARAPAPGVSTGLERTAAAWARAALDTLDYVGVLAIELFETADDGLLANEMAPRVHNSGHWTIEGAATSQFENHVRAVCGLPLGATAARGVSVMANFIGEIPVASDVLRIPGAHYHDYGKTPRAGRKLGHVTLLGDSSAEIEARLRAVGRLAGVSV